MDRISGIILGMLCGMCGMFNDAVADGVNKPECISCGSMDVKIGAFIDQNVLDSLTHGHQQSERDAFFGG